MLSTDQISSLKSCVLSELELPEGLVALSSKIRSCFMSQNSSMEIMHAVSSQLQQFGKIGVETLIKEILVDENLLLNMAATSYLHKNGFYKIILFDDKIFRIRLHIWMPDAISKETLHNHRWYIASTIIKGELHSEIWEDSASIQAQCYDEYMYLGKHVDPVYIGKARVEMVQSIRRKAGEAYVLRPHVLHRIISHSQGMTATLICRSFGGCEWSRNIIVNNLVPNVKPNYLKIDEFEHVLMRYLKGEIHETR